MRECLSSNLDPDPGNAKFAAVLASVVMGFVVLGFTSNWGIALAVAVVASATFLLLISRFFRTRRFALFADGSIELEQDGEVSRYAVADVIRVSSTGNYKPGPRISITFTGGEEIPGLEPGDTAMTLQVLGSQLRAAGREDTIDYAARKYLLPGH